MPKQKMKALTRETATVGKKVVVADFVGTVVYTIAELSSTSAGYPLALLQYPIAEGKMANGGWHPVTGCYEPTKEQLAAPQ